MIALYPIPGCGKNKERHGHGRERPYAPRAGDVRDLWQIEAIESGHVLRLGAEMQLPSQAWLHFDTQPLMEVRSVRPSWRSR
jgi:hypothetical protein